MEKKSNELFEVLNRELSLENIKASVNVFNQLYRYTGREQGEKAAFWILDKLKEYGLTPEELKYEAYTSLPISARIWTEDREWKALGAVFSNSIENLNAPLMYDELGEKKDLTWKEKEERFERMNGHIVLTLSGGGVFARKAAKAGAKAVIQMQDTWENQIHHANIGAVWGTPVPGDKPMLELLPFATVNRQTGEELKKYVGTSEIHLSIQMDVAILKTTMPVVKIEGKSSKYVMVSGHYDSWYEGITDNAVADAIMLEYARILKKHQSELKRGVQIGWWSGHSDARYSGSAWFFDHHYTDLKKNCVGHINIDLAGCRDSEQVRVRTTLMEGADFTGNVIRTYTGREPSPYIPMIRGADQSFWGADIPVHIMLKYEVLPEKRTFSCPSGGAWWHSNEDTIDKMDDGITMRDARMNGYMMCRLIEDSRIPVQFGEYFAEMTKFLNQIRLQVPQELKKEVERVEAEFGYLQEEVAALEKNPEYHTEASDEIIIAVAGGLNRLVYSSTGCWDQDWATSAAPFRKLSTAAGMNRENTEATDYLFISNEFVRQVNRLTDGLEELRRKSRMTRLQWETNREQEGGKIC